MDSRDPWFRPNETPPESQPPKLRAGDQWPTHPSASGRDWPEQRRPSGPSGALWLLLAGSVVFGVAIIGLAVWQLVQLQIADDQLPPRIEEPTEAKYRQAAAAFSDETSDAPLPPDHPDQQDMARIHELFETLGNGFRNGDWAIVEDRFDFSRMWQEVRRTAPEVELSPWQDRRARLNFGPAFLQGIMSNRLGYAYERFEIRGCHFDDDRKEVVVFMRQWNEGSMGKTRWWLTRRDGRWRVYDREELETSLRMTTLDAMMLPLAVQGILAAPDVFPRIYQAMRDEDWSTAETLLDGEDFSRFPSHLQAVRWMLKANVDLTYGRCEQALNHCDRAEALHADMPILSLQRAAALNGLGRYEEARQAAQNFLDLLGTDDAALLHLGIALAGLDRPEEAIEAHRRALDDDPDAHDNLIALAGLLPADQKAEVGERFARCREPAAWFDALCGHLTLHGDAGAIEAMVAAYAPLRPDDPDVAYYGAWVLAHREEHLAAAEKVHAVLHAVRGRDDELAFVNLYLDAMTAAGQALDGYRNAPDAAHAFEYLAADAVYEQRVDDLKAVLSAHRETHPGDPWLDYYAGALAGLQDDWDTAVECYRAGWHAQRHDGAPDEYTDETHRAAMYREAFEGLAWRFREDMDVDGLALLIEMHRLGEANDPMRDAWAIQLLC